MNPLYDRFKPAPPAQAGLSDIRPTPDRPVTLLPPSDEGTSLESSFTAANPPASSNASPGVEESTPSVISSPDSSSPDKQPSSLLRFNRPAFLITGVTVLSIMIIAGIVTMLLPDKINRKSADYGVGSLSLAGIENKQLQLAQAAQLTVNGQLRVSDGFVLSPQQSAPANPSTGQFYLNSDNKQLYYYNGTSFVNLVTDQSLAALAARIPVQGGVGVNGRNGVNGTNGTSGSDGATGATGPQGPGGVGSCTYGDCVSLQATSPGTQEIGNINLSGSVIAANFSGDGSALTSVNAAQLNGQGASYYTNASNISSGTLSDSRLSGNVALLNGTGPQTFTGNNKFTGTVLAQNATNSTTAFQVQNSGGSTLLDVDTANGFVGIGTTGPGYRLDVQGGDVNTTGIYRVNGTQISSTNLSNDANLAKLNGTNSFSAANTFTSTVAIQGANSLTLGSGVNLGSVTFRDGATANTASLSLAGALGANASFQLPVSSGTQTLCTVQLGNCAGSGSGITGSGTTNKIAKFNGAQSLADSSISDDGTTVTVAVGQVIQGSSGLTLGVSSTSNGQIVFKNSTNANSLTLQSGVMAGNLTLTLPTGDGSNGSCLKTNGSGVLSFAACTGGSGGGVTSVNTLTGVLNLVGTANQINVSSVADTITLSFPQDINTTSNVTFRTIILTGTNTADNLIVANALSGATGKLLDLKVNNVSQFTVDASGNANTTGQYQVNGSQISSANLSNDANLAKLNGTGPQTFTGNNKFTGTVTQQNASNSTTAFQIQNSAGTSNLFNADTTNTRIGIGTLAPGYTLDVNGDINTTGVYRINGVTVCSVSGCTAASGSGNYIQNGTGTQIANFNIQSAAAGSIGAIVKGAVSQTADLLQLQTSGLAILASVGATGATLFQNSANSATAFQIQNAAGNSFVTADSTNTQLIVGKASTLTGKIAFATSAGANTITLVGPSSNPSGNYTLTIPTITANANLCTDNSVCTGYAPSATNGYVQLAPSTIQADATANNSIFINKTNGTGNILELQKTASDVFVVGNTGNITATGTYNTNTFNSSTLTFGAAGTASIDSASGQTLQIGTAANDHTVTLGSTIGTSPLTLQSGTSGVLVKGANGTTAFQIQNASAQTLLVANTTAQQLAIGPAAVPANSVLTIGTNTTANTGGIYFGTDTNLYRSAANTLKTDHNLTVTGAFTANNVALFKNSSDATGAFQVQKADASIVLSVNTVDASVGIGTTGTSTDRLFVTTGTKVGLTVNETGSSNILQLQQSASNVLSVSSTGAVLSKNSTNSTTAFQIQNASAQTLLVADTTNQRLAIGPAAVPANSVLTVGTSTTAASGGIYFGTDTNLYRSAANSLKTDGNVYSSVTGSTSGSPREIGFVDGNTGGLYQRFRLSGSVGIQDGDGQQTQLYSYWGTVIQGSRQTVGTPSFVAGAASDPSLTVLGATAANTVLKVQGAASQSGALLDLQTFGGTSVASIGATGATLFKNSTNSTTAFQIQNAASANLFQIDTTGNNIVLGGNNSGELQTWATNSYALACTTPGCGSPVGNYDQTSVTINGYIYTIGGFGGATIVRYAKLNADGSTGAWGTTTALPTGYEWLKATAANGYIYVTGGMDGGSVMSSKVYYGKVNSDGTVSSWTTNSFDIGCATAGCGSPAPRAYHTVEVANGYIYITGGYNTAFTAFSTVYFAKLNADGSTGAWTTNSYAIGCATPGCGSPVTQAQHTSAVANGYMYIFSGNAGSTAVYYAPMNPTTGTVGPWSSGTNMPGVRTFQTAAVANGYVYIIGGSPDGTTPLSSVYYATLNSSTGAIGSWTLSAATGLGARFNHSTVAKNGYIYVIGGENPAGTGTSTVQYASTQRIKVGGALDLVGLSGGTLADGETGVGGELTAGNTTIVGSLNVQGGATFDQGVSILGPLSVTNSASFKGTADAATSIRIENTNAGSNVYNQVEFASNGGTYNIGTSSTASTYAGMFYIYDPTAGAARLNINSSGNVGIGTNATSPAYRLDVRDSQATNYVAQISNTNTANTADGLLINLGVANASRATTNYFIGFAGAGTVAGKIQGGASAVAYTTTAADYAEYFLAANPNDKPQAGQIVALAPNPASSVDKATNTSSAIVGVISDNPGFLGNGPLCQVDDDNCDSDYGQTNVIVGMTGQLPVKVSAENGAIQSGDAISIGSVNGVGVKSTGSGQIVGYAMESFNGTGTGTIKVYINPGYHAPSSASYIQNGGSATLNDLTVNGTANFANLNVSGNTTVANLMVTGDATIQGKLTVGSIEVGDILINGHIVTAGATPVGELLSASGTGSAFDVSGNDTLGTITITTGSNPQLGELLKFNFAKSYTKPPKILVSPANDKASAAQFFRGSTSNDDFILNFNSAPEPNTTYKFDYFTGE